jgi:hypothetical protein
MNAHDLFVILHLLLFCYWLGGDIGVFYSSGMVADPKLSNSARMTAAKIMIGLDIVPRLCSAVMLTVGGILTEFIGIEHPTWQMALIILLAPVWVASELILHFKHDAAFANTVRTLDLLLKWAVIIGCIVSVGLSFADGRLAAEPWVGYKILVFAAIVFCSLMINRTIGPYMEGIQQIAAGSITDTQTDAMAVSLKKVKWAVMGIWAGLVIEVFLGVIRPGSAAMAEAISSLL